MIRIGTSAKIGSIIIIKCFIFMPPKNSIDNISNMTHIVIDILGSNIIKSAIIDPAPNTGNIVLNLRILS